MNEKLKKALQAALKLKGLNEGLAGKFITVEKEEDIEGAINDFVELNPAPVVDLKDPAVVKAIDQARTQAVKTNTANLAKKYNFDPNAEPGNDPNPDTPPGPPANETPREKALREQLEKLQKSVDGITTGKDIAEKQASAAAALNASKILPENLRKGWASRIDLNSETSFEDQVKALETEHTETEQSFKNSMGYAGKPQSGFSSDKPTDSEIDAIISI